MKPAPSRSRASGVVTPSKLTLTQRVLAAMIYLLIRTLILTLRWRFVDRTAIIGQEPLQPVIFCIWHNRLALALPIFQRYPQRLQPARRLAAIVSASRDGALLTRVLEHFRVQPVRGSSSRRGAQALLELTSWADRGLDLAITPDGPRGPCARVQDGAIALGQLTGRPLIPVSYRTTWHIRLKSWDRFIIPLPFGKVVVTLGEPVQVPRDADDAARESCRQKLEQSLRAMDEEAP